MTPGTTCGVCSMVRMEMLRASERVSVLLNMPVLSSRSEMLCAAPIRCACGMSGSMWIRTAGRRAGGRAGERGRAR
eukprot:4742577-Prymnesium_polylepis.1